jgi:hypothetical protein
MKTRRIRGASGTDPWSEPATAVAVNDPPVTEAVWSDREPNYFSPVWKNVVLPNRRATALIETGTLRWQFSIGVTA